MCPLPFRLPLSVITSPPQSPPLEDGVQKGPKTEGHEAAAARTASALSLKLVKIFLAPDAEASNAPPLMVMEPPSDFTTSPGPTVSFPP